MSSESVANPKPLAQAERVTILVVSFLGWFFGGMQILLTNLGMRAAALDLMGKAGWLDLVAYDDLNQRADLLTAVEKAQLVDWNAMA
ncbi:MAG: hypothetical protein AAF514_17795, partial [Verrucomicrobiota bacterium]